MEEEDYEGKFRTEAPGSPGVDAAAAEMRTDEVLDAAAAT